MSQSYSPSGISDAAFCCQYCSSLLNLVSEILIHVWFQLPTLCVLLCVAYSSVHCLHRRVTWAWHSTCGMSICSSRTSSLSSSWLSSSSSMPSNTTLWIATLTKEDKAYFFSGCWLVVAASNKKLSYRRGTARCVVSIEILPIATQQCRNYLYDKSWPFRWYEVGDLVGGNAW